MRILIYYGEYTMYLMCGPDAMRWAQRLSADLQRTVMVEEAYPTGWVKRAIFINGETA